MTLHEITKRKISHIHLLENSFNSESLLQVRGHLESCGGIEVVLGEDSAADSNIHGLHNLFDLCLYQKKISIYVSCKLKFPVKAIRIRLDTWINPFINFKKIESIGKVLKGSNKKFRIIFEYVISEQIFAWKVWSTLQIKTKIRFNWLMKLKFA